MVPGERALLAIGYKNNTKKVISCVATAGVGSTTLGIPYLWKYPDQFYNVSIRPVACPLLLSKFFGSVNEVDSHNKLRKSYIGMDKFRVAKCGWL